MRETWMNGERKAIGFFWFLSLFERLENLIFQKKWRS